MVLGRLPLMLVAASFSAAIGGNAFAQSEADRAQARDLGEQGYAAMQAHDYAKAAELFQRADSLYHAPTLLLGLARAEGQLGKYVESWEHYHRIVLEGAPQNAPAAIRNAVESAKKEMAQVEGHRARLTITIKGPAQPSVTLDGATLPTAALGVERPVNPGQHVAHVTAQGWTEQEKRFAVADGGNSAVTIELQPAPASDQAQAAVAPATPSAPATTGTPAPTGGPTTNDAGRAHASSGSGRKTLAWTGIAVGGAGIVAGLVTGGLAMGSRSSASSSPCANGPCDSGALASYQSDRNNFYSLAQISTIAFIAGGVLGGAGVVLLVTSPSAEHSTSTAWVTPFVGPTQAGVTGRF
jgi:hypothetical protein